MTRRYVLLGEEVAAPNRNSKTIMWYDPDGFDLLETLRYPKSGNHLYKTAKSRALDKIILHWGGSSPKRLVKTLAGKTRDRKPTDPPGTPAGYSDLDPDEWPAPTSTHFGIWKDEIQQFVDLDKQTYASGHANVNSIGVDIAQEPPWPAEKWAAWFKSKQGLDVKVIDNPSEQALGRGKKQMVSLNPQTAASLRDFLMDMNQLFGVPLRVAVNPDGSYFFGTLSKSDVASFQGILGHFQTSKNKSDPAGWWAYIFDPLVASGVVQKVVVGNVPKVQTRTFTPKKSTTAAPTRTTANAPSNKPTNSPKGTPSSAPEKSGGGGGGGAVAIIGVALALVGGYFAWKRFKK